MQASVSALYVAVVTPPGTSPVSTRFVDALVGGSIALLLAQLRTVRDPFGPLVEQLDATLGELADTLEQTAAALAEANEPATRTALMRARAANDVVSRLREAVRAAEEASWWRPRRGQRVAVIETLERASNQVDYAVRGARVLARASVTLSRQHGVDTTVIANAVLRLAAQARHVSVALSARVLGDEGLAEQAKADARLEATAAVGAAAEAISRTSALPVVMLAGQVRMTAVDLLRAADLDASELLEQFDASLGLVDQ